MYLEYPEHYNVLHLQRMEMTGY